MNILIKATPRSIEGSDQYGWVMTWEGVTPGFRAWVNESLRNNWTISILGGFYRYRPKATSYKVDTSELKVLLTYTRRK
jgi:hypothetical protein